MLTPSLLLQAFQLPPSLKCLDSESQRQPDAERTMTRQRTLPLTEQLIWEDEKAIGNPWNPACQCEDWVESCFPKAYLKNKWQTFPCSSILIGHLPKSE